MFCLVWTISSERGFKHVEEFYSARPLSILEHFFQRELNDPPKNFRILVGFKLNGKVLGGSKMQAILT